jgi:hypothetical protein
VGFQMGVEFSARASGTTVSANTPAISVSAAGPTISFTKGTAVSETKYVSIDSEKLAIDGEYLTID